VTSLSFLIVNYHTAPFVVKLVESIRTFITRLPYEILIYDNSADDGERNMLELLSSPDCRQYFSAENRGFVAANNALALEANNDMLVLINPDTLLTDSSLEALCEYAASREDVGAAGPMLLNGDGSYQVGHYKFPTLWLLMRQHLFFARNPYVYDPIPDGPAVCDVIKGACLTVRRSVVGSGPLFDPDLVMFSEEVDLCWRLRMRGLKSVFFPRASIVHYGEQSTGRKEYSAYSVRHYYRSKLIFWKKNRPTAPYVCAKYILYLSLMEKTVVLALTGRVRSASITASALGHLFNEFGW
jgi:GT2 family glycosyltransferase